MGKSHLQGHQGALTVFQTLVPLATQAVIVGDKNLTHLFYAWGSKVIFFI